MADFVTLSCPSCGGKLTITNDIERFACAHCGNEHVVNRSGYVVSLAPVVDELKKVQAGVDKTASELAIKRLTQEIEELGQQYAALWDKRVLLEAGLLSFLKRREIEQLTEQLDRIMKLARKKNAELEKHRQIVSL